MKVLIHSHTDIFKKMCTIYTHLEVLNQFIYVNFFR